MSRLRSAAAQLFALFGLLVLGLAIARALDLALAYEHWRLTGDGRTFSAILSMLGTVYLPVAGTMLLAALVLSLPRGVRLPVLRARLLGFVATFLSFAVLVVVAARAVAAEGLAAGAGDLLVTLGLELALALPVAFLVAALAGTGVALWRAGSREA